MVLTSYNYKHVNRSAGQSLVGNAINDTSKYFNIYIKYISQCIWMHNYIYVFIEQQLSIYVFEFNLDGESSTFEGGFLNWKTRSLSDQCSVAPSPEFLPRPLGSTVCWQTEDKFKFWCIYKRQTLNRSLNNPNVAFSWLNKVHLTNMYHSVNNSFPILCLNCFSLQPSQINDHND